MQGAAARVRACAAPPPPPPLKKEAIRRMLRNRNAEDVIEIRRAGHQRFGMKYPRAIHIAELAQTNPRYDKIIAQINQLERFYITKPVPLIIRHNFRQNIDAILELVEDDEPELIEVCMCLLNEYGVN